MFKLKISNKPLQNFYNIDLEKHGLLGHMLKNKNGHLIQNIFEYSIVYESVGDEIFIVDNQLMDAYYKWRHAGTASPILTNRNAEPLYFIASAGNDLNLEPLDETQARKKIYFKES